MKLTMLGTGHAVVTEVYNTCFIMEENHRYFMVDGGGGMTLLNRLKYAHVDWRDIKDIFVTHKHIDHTLGIIWMLRLICQSMRLGQYEGDVNIYGNDEVLHVLKGIAELVFEPGDTAFIGDRIHLIEVHDHEEKEILNHKIQFFDIHSTGTKQFVSTKEFGFSYYYNDKDKLTCCGDEPFNEANKEFAYNSQWLMHEAFCLYAQKDIYHPYEKHHSTVKDACQLAQKMNVKNIILYHTEDDNLEKRKELYVDEGKQYFDGHVYVPDDLESFEL